MWKTLIILVFLTNIISGCGMADLINTIKGSYYMDQRGHLNENLRL